MTQQLTTTWADLVDHINKNDTWEDFTRDDTSLDDLDDYLKALIRAYGIRWDDHGVHYTQHAIEYACKLSNFMSRESDDETWKTACQLMMRYISDSALDEKCSNPFTYLEAIAEIRKWV